MFSTVDSVIIRWERGTVCVPPQGGGKEKYIEVRSLTSASEAVLLGQRLLDAYRVNRETFGITGHVFDDAQRPGDGFTVGDYLDGRRVQSISLGIDDEANTVVTPELGDPQAHRLTQLDRRIARIGSPVTSEWASPFPPRAKQGDRMDSTPPKFTFSTEPVREAVFSHTGAASGMTLTPAYVIPGPEARLRQVTVTLGNAGTTDTVVTIYINGAPYSTVTIPAGEGFASKDFAFDLKGNSDRIQVAVTSAGDGAQDIMVQARFIDAPEKQTGGGGPVAT